MSTDANGDKNYRTKDGKHTLTMEANLMNLRGTIRSDGKGNSYKDDGKGNTVRKSADGAEERRAADGSYYKRNANGDVTRGDGKGSVSYTKGSYLLI